MLRFRLGLHCAACALVSSLLSTSAAVAQITIDANFDSGSLKSYSVTRAAINLVGRDSYAFGQHPLGGDHWRWMYFKATGVLNTNPTFSVAGEFGGDNTDYPPTLANHELADHEMVYSYDGVNWEFFPHANNTLQNIGDGNSSNDLFTFNLGSNFTQNDVYVAYAIPYTYARSTAHAQKVIASPWATPTASGNANGVIGQSPAGVDDIGRSIPALDLYAYRITNPATDSATPKHRVMIATGQHASETLGIYTYEGLVDWLISDDPRAAALRDKTEILGYPTLNASGRYAGLNRSMLQWQNTDSNGYWYPNAVSSNDYVSPQRTEQMINGEAMRADKAATPGAVTDLFLDFHSSVPDYNIAGPNGEGGGGRDDWGYITNNAASLNNPWWLALKELQPNLLEETSGTTASSKTLTGFALGFLNAQMSVTLENQFGISRPISFYQDYGKNVGLAMYEAWIRVDNPLAADFDEDGDVDAGDLAAWKLGFGTLSNAEHYQGDANNDGVVDGADLLVWQREFGETNPNSAAAVPEPATIGFATISLICVHSLQRSSRRRAANRRK
ncbi:M14 family zinc carboxypeptidase [Lacipirellula sp.]|uniref:M14 family zinc carboxypeptidase n=1 Tax=Lacipirellula sp. TaxID=2691419 RepID=UPI003D152210